MLNTVNKIRILIAKPGLDGHDRGAKIVARALRDAGMEVIYSGLHRTPEEIVEMALQEDVQAIGLSTLSGAHMTLFPKVKTCLVNNQAEDILLFGGGIIPEKDAEDLKKQGFQAIFGPGTSMDEIVMFLQNYFKGAVMP